MVLYSCFRCGYSVSHRGNFFNHLNRKNICKPLLEECNIEFMKNYYTFKNPQIPSKNPQKPSLLDKKSPQKPSLLDKNLLKNPQLNENDPQKPSLFQTDDLTCNYCLKICSRKDNLKRHLITCKKKKESEQIMIIEKDKEIEKLKKQLEKNNNINITNNTNNTNNITNNNIIINNIGEENTKYLKSLDFANLLQGIYGAVPKLIEQIHFNPEYPENQNIKYPNKKNPYLKIMKNNKWQLVNKKPELLDLIDSKYFLLKEKYYNILEKTQYKLTEFQKQRINQFIDKYQEDDKQVMLDLINRTELVLLNNS